MITCYEKHVRRKGGATRAVREGGPGGQEGAGSRTLSEEATGESRLYQGKELDVI